MKAIYTLNRLLCRCLEVINILATVPLGAFIYVACLDHITHSTEMFAVRDALLNNVIAINVMAAGLALVGVILINGAIAQALDKRRFLEDIARSVDEHEQHHNRWSDANDGIAPHHDISPSMTKAGGKTSRKI